MRQETPAERQRGLAERARAQANLPYFRLDIAYGDDQREAAHAARREQPSRSKLPILCALLIAVGTAAYAIAVDTVGAYITFGVAASIALALSLSAWHRRASTGHLGQRARWLMQTQVANRPTMTDDILTVRRYHSATLTLLEQKLQRRYSWETAGALLSIETWMTAADEELRSRGVDVATIHRRDDS